MNFILTEYLKALSSAFLLFNIIFVSFLWEFHIMHPDHTHLPVLSAPPTIVTRSPNNRKKKKPKYKPIRIICILTGHGQTLRGLPLKQSWALPSHTPDTASVERYTSASVLFAGFLFRLSLFLGGWGVEVGLSLSQKPSTPLFLNCASAVIDITAKVASLHFTVRGRFQITGFHMVSGDSKEHKHGPWLQ